MDGVILSEGHSAVQHRQPHLGGCRADEGGKTLPCSRSAGWRDKALSVILLGTLIGAQWETSLFWYFDYFSSSGILSLKLICELRLTCKCFFHWPLIMKYINCIPFLPSWNFEIIWLFPPINDNIWIWHCWRRKPLTREIYGVSDNQGRLESVEDLPERDESISLPVFLFSYPAESGGNRKHRPVLWAQ